eukprot:4166744-Prymnesium_polylepis.1
MRQLHGLELNEVGEAVASQNGVSVITIGIPTYLFKIITSAHTLVTALSTHDARGTFRLHARNSRTSVLGRLAMRTLHNLTTILARRSAGALLSAAATVKEELAKPKAAEGC